MNEATKSRQSGIELLKIIAIALIVFAHTITSHNNASFVGVTNPDAFADIFAYSLDPQMVTLLVLMGAAPLGNLIFMICSSWFLSQSSKISWGKEVGIILNTWIISTLFLIAYASAGHSFSLETILDCLFPTTTNVNWFVTCYLIVYAIHPFLNLVINAIDEKQATVFAIVSIVVYFVIGYFVRPIAFANNLISFVIIYLIVGLLRRFHPRWIDSGKINALLLVGGLVLYVLRTLALRSMGEGVSLFANKLMPYDNDDILLLAAALGSFNLFRRLKFHSGFVNYLSSLTLLVYLIHENHLFITYTRPKAYELWYSQVGATNYHSYLLLIVMATAVIVFVAAFLVSAFYKETIGRLVTLLTNRMFKPKPDQAPIGDDTKK